MKDFITRAKSLSWWEWAVLVLMSPIIAPLVISLLIARVMVLALDAFFHLLGE